MGGKVFRGRCYQSYRIRWKLLILLTAGLLLTGCEETVSGLTKAKYSSDTIIHSSRFQHYKLGDTEHAVFYKPISPDILIEKLAVLRPEHKLQFGKGDIPFEVDKEEAFLIQYGTKEVPKYQVQLSYYGKPDDYGRFGSIFYKVNMMEVQEDPFQMLAPYQDDDVDLFMNRVDVSKNEGTTFYHFFQTTNSSYAYSSYTENEETGDVSVTSTRADEIMFYKNGLMVEIGYLVPGGYDDSGTVPDETLHAEMLKTAQKLAKQL
ncbi:hypothetical protein [Paenibacillus sp. Marseille-Q4541]|uniref:hypothetical protein n=1 Tax=Paenibacillus sp. Marseille-Q4541 TaxID=2831522 RepID=UPI001BAA04EF|nr:hypothetical protein [Paenibacillus sp. Marseille-Q4541]